MSEQPVSTVIAAQRVGTLLGRKVTPRQLRELVEEGRLSPGTAADGSLRWSSRDVMDAVDCLERLTYA